MQSEPAAPSTTAPRSITYPGKTLGIVGFIISFITNPLGLILSIIAFVQSKKAGYKNNFALAGIIIGAAFLIIGAIVVVVVAPSFVNTLSDVVQKCKDLGPGTHIVGSTTYTCN